LYCLFRVDKYCDSGRSSIRGDSFHFTASRLRIVKFSEVRWLILRNRMTKSNERPQKSNGLYQCTAECIEVICQSLHLRLYWRIPSFELLVRCIRHKKWSWRHSSNRYINFKRKCIRTRLKSLIIKIQFIFPVIAIFILFRLRCSTFR